MSARGGPGGGDVADLQTVLIEDVDVLLRRWRRQYAGRPDDFITAVCTDMLPAAAKVGVVDAVDGFVDSIGFTGIILNYQDKSYTAADLDGAVAGIQRDILQIADYLHDVGADMNLLKYYQSVLKSSDTRYITNEQALDLGIAVMFEETGQLIEPIVRKP